MSKKVRVPNRKHRIIKPFLLILFLYIIFIYVCNITFMPNNIIVFQGEDLQLKTVLGLSIKNKSFNNYEVLKTSTTDTQKVSNNVGTTNLSLNLFGTIPIKEIGVNVIPRTKVIPLGNCIGLKLYTKGVLVVGMSEITGDDNLMYRPYSNSGIKEGDMIIEVNNTAIENTNDLIRSVNKSNGKEITITYIRNESKEVTSIIPVKTLNNEYKLGLWVRDAQARSWNCNFLRAIYRYVHSFRTWYYRY